MELQLTTFQLLFPLLVRGNATIPPHRATFISTLIGGPLKATPQSSSWIVKVLTALIFLAATSPKR